MTRPLIPIETKRKGATASTLTLMQRDVLKIQLRASAALNMQLAASLIGKGQEEMRKHFQQNAEVMMAALEQLNG